MHRPVTRPPITLADLAQQKRAVVVCCRGCSRTVQKAAADLVALGVPGELAALEAGTRMVCRACGSRHVETWPAIVLAKGYRGDGR